MHDIRNQAVSVCIPVFNGAAFIHECIQSVLSQSFEDFELLIVDNASTDNTMEICSAFSDARIRIHRGDTNIGALGNFKKCFELARGKLVLLLPCDDLLEPDCLAILVAPLLTNAHIGLAFGRTRVINSVGEFLSEPCFAENGLLNPDQSLNFIVNNFNPIQHPLVRRSSYFEHGGFQKKYGCFVDIALWIKIARSSKSIYLAAEVTTCIRLHPTQGQNIMNNMNADNLANVANHFGIRSLKQHQYRSSYNLCFLRFTKSLELLNAEHNVPSENVIKILSKLVESNIMQLAKALLRWRVDQLNLELIVYRRIHSQFKKTLAFKIYVKEMFLLLCHLPRGIGRLNLVVPSRKSNLQKIKSRTDHNY